MNLDREFLSRAAVNAALLAGAFAAGWVSMLPLLDHAVEQVFAPRHVGSVESGPWATRLDLARSTTSAGVRAYIAQVGLAANQAEEALYWTALVDDAGRRLDGKHHYSLVFHTRPPVADTGFWSLTVYGADYFLVPNPQKRYSIGDRSPLKKNDDGSFAVAISAQQPSTDVDNWLPSPPDGPFVLTLRMFVPLPATLEHPASTPMPSIQCLDCG